MSSNTSWLQTLLPIGEDTSLENDVKAEIDINVHVICSIDCVKNKVGCSIINIDEGKILCLPEDFNVRRVNEMTKEKQECPSCIETSIDINIFIDMIVREYQVDQLIYTTRVADFIEKFMSRCAAQFNIQSHLISLKYHKWDGNFQFPLGCEVNDREFQIYLNSSVYDNKLSLGTFFSLIRWHDEIVKAHIFPKQFQIFEYIEFNNRLQIDSQTFAALHILKGSNYLVNNSTKRNDSILTIEDLFNSVKTTLGKKILKQWLHSPTTDILILKMRLETIEVLSRTENQELTERFKKNTTVIPDIQYQFQRLNSDILNTGYWGTLLNFIDGCLANISIFECLTCQDVRATYLEEIKNNDFSFLFQLFDVADKTIDLHLLINENTLEIKEGIYSEYDNCKILYQRLESTLAELVQKVLTEIVDLQITDLNVRQLEKMINAIYIPELGFLLVLDTSLKNLIEEPELFGDWELVFDNSGEMFFKNQDIIELDKIYGGIYSHMSALKIDVLQKMKEEFQQQITNLIDVAKLCAVLEVLISFTEVSIERNYSKPHIKEDSVDIIIKNGRHPLQETLIHNFIENDIELKGGIPGNPNWYNEYHRMIILTGPNGSGKSLFMEQIALIVYMAHIGCFVPAQSATIGLVDKLLTRLQSKDSINSLHSTFEMDSIRVSNILSMLSERSLVLIDEYGVGTDVISGQALLGAIVKRYSNFSKCPRMIISTHFNDLFLKNGPLTNLNGVHYLTTKVIVTSQSDTSDNSIDDITFLYKIVEGICEESLGIHCASLCGIDESIILKAQAIQKKFVNGDDIRECLGNWSKDHEKLFEQSQMILKHFIAWDAHLEKDVSAEYLKAKLNEIISTSKSTIF